MENNRNLKVVFTTFTYYPNNDGVQNVTEYQAEGLVTLGYNVVVITPSEKLQEYEEEHNGVRIIRVPIGYKNHRVIGDTSRFIDMVKSETDGSSVLISVCLQNYVENIVLKHIDEFDCKKILYIHGAYEYKWHKTDYSNGKSIALKALLNAKYHIYYARNLKQIKKYDRFIQIHPLDYANTYFEKKYKITSDIIENSVEDVFFDAKLLEKDSVLCVSNYYENKNQEFLMEAFYRAHISKEISLILIGQTETRYYYKLIQLKNKYDALYGKRDVKILVGIPRELIQNYYQKAYVFLFSSKLEKCPICIMEAMASGIPFISTDTGSVRFNPGGVIVHAVDEMSYWLEKFVDNKYLREQYGTIGKNYSRNNYRISVSVNKLNSIIKQLMQV